MNQQRPLQVQQVHTGVRRVLATNPSPMTYWGTNTFLLGVGDIAVIDPGPDDPAHLQAILAALGPGETISHIFVTHAHLDHSPLAGALSRTTGAPVYAYGGPTAGRSAIMRDIADTGLVGGGEGVDLAFVPDIQLQDGQTICARSWTLTAYWTPGHFGNHMCFFWGSLAFTGDHVMAWAPSLISPPDGDLTDFMASLRRLSGLGATVMLPAHGPEVTDPALRIDWLLSHRQGRAADILTQLARGADDIVALTRHIYHDTPSSLLPAAERNVFAHLIDLVQSGQVLPVGSLAVDATFKLV